MAHTAALETSPANHRILERSLGAARFLQGPPLDIDHYKWVRGVLPRLERRVGIKVAQKRNRSAEAVVRLLDHLHEHHGRVCVRCAEIAVSCCDELAHASRVGVAARRAALDHAAVHGLYAAGAAASAATEENAGAEYASCAASLQPYLGFIGEHRQPGTADGEHDARLRGVAIS